MKAKILPRINLENRTRLEEVIPLSTPMVLFVDPANICNFRCKFCPTGNRDTIQKTGRWQGLLDFGLYRKIIDDLAEFERPLKVLRLYKDGEPLLNDRFADMVRYAKKSGYVEYVDTTTNGSLLSPERIKPVIDAGIDRINISVDGLSNEHFLEFTRTRVDFDRFLENIRLLYESKGDCEICIKTVGDILSEEDKQRFYRLFGDIADRVFIENVAPCWPTFDVQEHVDVRITRGIYGQPITDVQVCPYIFYSISLNSDGTASLCFLDWARKLPIGDACNQSVKEIWDGETLLSHQLANLRGERRKTTVCSECGQLTHGCPDNLDPFAEGLVNRLIETRSVRYPSPAGVKKRGAVSA